MLVADRGLRQYGRVWQFKSSLCYAMLPRLSAQYLGEPSPGRVGLRRSEIPPTPTKRGRVRKGCAPVKQCIPQAKLRYTMLTELSTAGRLNAKREQERS